MWNDQICENDSTARTGRAEVVVNAASDGTSQCTRMSKQHFESRIVFQNPGLCLPCLVVVLSLSLSCLRLVLVSSSSCPCIVFVSSSSCLCLCLVFVSPSSYLCLSSCLRSVFVSLLSCLRLVLSSSLSSTRLRLSLVLSLSLSCSSGVGGTREAYTMCCFRVCASSCVRFWINICV